MWQNGLHSDRAKQGFNQLSLAYFEIAFPIDLLDILYRSYQELVGL
jgi:hypothetical protein